MGLKTRDSAVESGRGMQAEKHGSKEANGGQIGRGTYSRHLRAPQVGKHRPSRRQGEEHIMGVIPMPIFQSFWLFLAAQLSTVDQSSVTTPPAHRLPLLDSPYSDVCRPVLSLVDALQP